MITEVAKRVQDYFEKNCEYFLEKNLLFHAFPKGSSDRNEIDKFFDHIFFFPIISLQKETLKDKESWVESIAKIDNLADYVDSRFQHYIEGSEEGKNSLVYQRKGFLEARSLSKLRPEKLNLLRERLIALSNSFSELTGYEPHFSEEIEEFINGRMWSLYVDGKIDEITAKGIFKQGYRAWTGLNLVLSLNPSDFFILDENLNFVKADNSLPFLMESFSVKGYSPRFAFFSKLTGTWIGFAIGMSVEYFSPRPDIWLRKSKKLADLKYFNKLIKGILIECMEEPGWIEKIPLSRKYPSNPKHKSTLSLLKTSVKDLDPAVLFVICWQKEDGPIETLTPTIRILHDVNLKNQKLLPVVRELNEIP